MTTHERYPMETLTGMMHGGPAGHGSAGRRRARKTVRTCPAPTPFALIRLGDRIRWQREGMDSEDEAVIVEQHTSRLVTDSGREVLPFHYIVRLDADGRPEAPPVEAVSVPLPAQIKATRPASPTQRYTAKHWRNWVSAVTRRIDGGEGIAQALAATNEAQGTRHNEASYRQWSDRLGIAPKLEGQALRLRGLVGESRPRCDEDRQRLVLAVNAGVDERGLTVPEALAEATALTGLTASEKLYYQWRARLDLPLRSSTRELVRRRATERGGEQR